MQEEKKREDKEGAEQEKKWAEAWPYEDLLYQPRHVSLRHPHMSLEDRAAQFSPFAALSGYGAAVRETERLTTERVELDENQKEVLNRQLQRLSRQLLEKKSSMWEIVYFQPDERKAGGCYRTVAGKVKKVEADGRRIELEDGSSIEVEEILELEELKIE